MFAAPCVVTLDSLNDFDLVYLSGITLAILPDDMRTALFDWAEGFCANGGTLAYDSNHRPRLWESQDAARAANDRMWSLCDIALPSLDDEMALHGDVDEASVLARLAQCGVNHGALKRGGKGPRDLATGTELTDLRAIETVVDTTAAGDSFNAGYLAAVKLGRSTAAAMQDGHSLASRVIQAPGAIVEI
jgi:2-dehydro-3-deoxygluconokinase